MGIFDRGIVRINNKSYICDAIGRDQYFTERGIDRVYVLEFSSSNGPRGLARNTHVEMRLLHNDFSLEETWGIYRIIECRLEIHGPGIEVFYMILAEVMSEVQSIFEDDFAEPGKIDFGPTF